MPEAATEVATEALKALQRDEYLQSWVYEDTHSGAGAVYPTIANSVMARQSLGEGL